MATQNISGKIQFRRDTAANWTSKNPTLLAGELGYETDTHKGKVGDGSTAWKNLPYVWKTTVATGYTNGTIAVDGTDVAVKGLGSAAYTASTAYAASSHNHDGRYIYWGGNASNNTAWGWGTLTVANGYTQHSHLTGSSGCEGGFASKGGQLNMQLDGYFYQNEGRYRCLDTSDSSSFASASHSHSNYAPTPWVATWSYPLTATANGQEWSFDQNPGSYTGTYSHFWSTKLGKSICQFFTDDCRVVIPNGTLTVSGTITSGGKAVSLSDHTHASNTINAMTGYSKPSTTSAITASDSLNTAIGKLEKALEPDVSLSINDPGGSSVWIEVPVEHLIVGSTTPTDHNAIWIEIIS